MQVNDQSRNRRSMLWLGVLCLLLQLALAPNIGVGNGRINFALVYAATFALAVGGRDGVVCGFLAGLVFDLSTTGPIGLMTLLLTGMSYVLGLEERNRFADGFPATMATFGVASLAVVFLYHLSMLLAGQASDLIDVIVMRTLPTFALTFVAFVPFAYFLCRSAEGGAGGVGRRRRGGGHLELRGL